MDQKYVLNLIFECQHLYLLFCLRVESKTSQSSFPGLSLCEVIVYGPGDDGEERILYELRQLVRAAGLTAGASHGGGL